MQTLSTHNVFYIVVTLVYLEKICHFRRQNTFCRHSTEHEKWKKCQIPQIPGSTGLPQIEWFGRYLALFPSKFGDNGWHVCGWLYNIYKKTVILVIFEETLLETKYIASGNVNKRSLKVNNNVDWGPTKTQPSGMSKTAVTAARSPGPNPPAACSPAARSTDTRSTGLSAEDRHYLPLSKTRRSE